MISTKNILVKSDPINEVLYTDRGELIKEMNFSYLISWEYLLVFSISSNVVFLWTN